MHSDTLFITESAANVGAIRDMQAEISLTWAHLLSISGANRLGRVASKMTTLPSCHATSHFRQDRSQEDSQVPMAELSWTGDQ